VEDDHLGGIVEDHAAGIESPGKANCFVTVVEGFEGAVGSDGLDGVSLHSLAFSKWP